MASGYKIGTSVVGLTAVESLTTPVYPPKSSYQPYQEAIDLGSRKVRGVGLPSTTWRWNIITAAQRAQLRTFCTGASAEVYIATRGDGDSFANFKAVMVWPQTEERDFLRRTGFEIIFRALEAV